LSRSSRIKEANTPCRVPIIFPEVTVGIGGNIPAGTSFPHFAAARIHMLTLFESEREINVCQNGSSKLPFWHKTLESAGELPAFQIHNLFSLNIFQLSFKSWHHYCDTQTANNERASWQVRSGGG
jgi:hypothetical protein